MHRTMTMVAVAMSVGMLACSSGSGVSEPARLLALGKAELSVGDARNARTHFEALAQHDGYDCEVTWGILLTDVLVLTREIDKAVESFIPFLDGIVRSAPGWVPQQVDSNLALLVDAFLAPFVAVADDLQAGSAAVLDSGCTFRLASGLPLDIGDRQGLFHMNVVLGDEWDPAAARIIAVEAAVVHVIHSFLAGHDLRIVDPTAVFGYLIDLLALLDSTPYTADTDRTSYIDYLRKLGGIFAHNPDLLALGDAEQLGLVDNHMVRVFDALYRGSDDSGLVPDMLARNQDDAALADNVLAWVDDGDGVAGNGDRVILGIKSLELFSTLSVDLAVTGAVELSFDGFNGDIGKVIEALHRMSTVLGDQFRAVDDPAVAWERLGLGEINQVIANTAFLSGLVPEMPEDLELDLRAFYAGPDGDGPRPLRDFLPYWHDHDNLACERLADDGEACSVDEFLVEGESAVTTYTAVVGHGDTAHFPDRITFVAGNGSAKDVTGLRLAPDGLDPAMTKTSAPFVYVAFRDPSFGNMLWLDPTRFPVRPIAADHLDYDDDPDDGHFRPATHFSLNYGLNAFLYYLDEELSPDGLANLLPWP